MKMEKIVNALCGDVWCIHPDKLEAICEVINVRLAGGFRSDAEIKAAIAQAKENVSMTVEAANGESDQYGGSVAVLSLYGTLAQRTSAFDSGAVSVERFGKNFDAAISDPSVGSVVIDIDSPGGSVFGIEEMAEKIYNARGRKKIVAVANSCAASGAYWIAAAADEIVVTSGGEVGSVGVFCLHQDQSGAYQQIGIKHTFIKAGEHKAEANPFEPLDPGAQEYIQQRVNERYNVFTKAIAKYRGVSVGDVLANFGQGRMKMAKAAVKSKMADAVGTLEYVIEELSANKHKSFGSKAACDNNVTETELNDQGDQTMADKDKTVDTPDTDQIASEAAEQAKNSERERLADLKAEFPNDLAFAVEQFEAGASVLEAKAAYSDVLQERIEADKSKSTPEKKTEASTDGAPPLANNNEGSVVESKADFMDQAKELAAEKNISLGTAVSRLAKAEPELHKAYLGRKR